jgi:hypothetical protein
MAGRPNALIERREHGPLALARLHDRTRRDRQFATRRVARRDVGLVGLDENPQMNPTGKPHSHRNKHAGEEDRPVFSRKAACASRSVS